jgi:hypothetical protein
VPRISIAFLIVGIGLRVAFAVVDADVNVAVVRRKVVVERRAGVGGVVEALRAR